MSMTDSIADMLTRIRNGQKSKFISISLPSSKMKIRILNVLKEEGYIKNYIVHDEDKVKPYLEVQLKYSSEGNPSILEIQRVSKPSKRVYSSIESLKGYYNNMGIFILSTSKGVMSDRQAHSLEVGGEVICKVF